MKKVFVGLSGGVDSAVSAALLKEQGYAVTGTFIKIWQPEFLECSWEKDRLDAMRVCAALEIPFKEIDLSAEYKKEVIQDLIDGYRKGVTPNPDVLCNRKIKFGPFAAWAFREGADFIATGHYARIKEREGTYRMLRGKDAGKDQSYFLWQLSAHDLSRILFPVGNLHKKEVREYAEKNNLPVAKKPDSQGLCFVGDVSMPEFLSRYIPLEKGDVLDESGAVIGTHDGASLYTLGQRHGFRIDSKSEQAAHYVIATDMNRNTVTVSENRAAAAVREIELTELNWVHSEPDFSQSFLSQVRYREEPVTSTVRKSSGVHVLFDTPRIATPGQSLVLYNDDELIGGGIMRAVKN